MDDVHELLESMRSGTYAIADYEAARRLLRDVGSSNWTHEHVRLNARCCIHEWEVRLGMPVPHRQPVEKR